MSDAGRAYVEKHSPYTGAMFLIHLRLGNIENDTYNHRLFISDDNLAKLCRCSTKTVQRAKAQMVEDGFLRLLKPAKGQRIAEYEFLFPDTSVNITLERIEDDEVGGQNVQPSEKVGGHSVQVGGHLVQVGGHFVPENETSPIYRNKEIESTESTYPIPAEVGDTRSESAHLAPKQKPKPYITEFEALWSVYPRKVGKGVAYEAVVARLRAKVPFETLLRATENYARLRAGEPEVYTLHPSTFYGAKLRYEDYLAPTSAVKSSTTKNAYSDIEAFLMNGAE